MRSPDIMSNLLKGGESQMDILRTSPGMDKKPTLKKMQSSNNIKFGGKFTSPTKKKTAGLKG